VFFINSERHNFHICTKQPDKGIILYHLPLVIKNVLKYALPCNDMKLANLLFLFPEKCGLEELQKHSYKGAA
jgi:hypothetical protein